MNIPSPEHSKHSWTYIIKFFAIKIYRRAKTAMTKNDNEISEERKLQDYETMKKEKIRTRQLQKRDLVRDKTNVPKP